MNVFDVVDLRAELTRELQAMPLARDFDVPSDDYRDLLLIEYANLAEQMPFVEKVKTSGKYEQIRNLLLNEFGIDLPAAPEAGPSVDLVRGIA